MRRTPIAGPVSGARFKGTGRLWSARICDGVPAVTAPGISFGSLLFLASFAALFVALALAE